VGGFGPDGLRKLHPHRGGVSPRGDGREAGRGDRKQPPPADAHDPARGSRPVPWVKIPAHAVKGVIGARELRARRGYPDQMDAA